MHTQAWIRMMEGWRLVAFSECRWTLYYSLQRAIQEMAYATWCDSGRDPREWSK